jgi:hypothetical protein
LQGFTLRERVADPSGSAQGALDILVAGRFLEKNLNGAAGALPGITASNSARPISEKRLALVQRIWIESGIGFFNCRKWMLQLGRERKGAYRNAKPEAMEPTNLATSLVWWPS